jgi:hypothetical protein
MGWRQLFVLHASGPQATAATISAAGYAPIGLRLPVDQAVSELDDLAPDGLAVVGRDRPGLHVVARFLDHDELALALSADGGETVTFLWEAVTDSYVLSVFRDGRPARRLVRADGEIVVDEGPALPVEVELGWSADDGDLDADATLLALAGALTDEPVGHDTWRTRPAAVHRRRRAAR